MNEIMYDPVGDDNNKEFIELLLEEPANLSGFIIGDTASNDTLTALYYSDSYSDSPHIPPAFYALIVEEGFDYAGINASVYSVGSTIGNNLDNNGDALFFYSPNGTLLTTVRYDGQLARGNGRSLEFLNDQPYESKSMGGTPGRENSIVMAAIISSLNASTPNTTIEDTINDKDTANEDTTNEDAANEDTVNDETSPPMECRPNFAITTPKDVYQHQEQIAFSFRLNNTADTKATTFLIEYGIEDLLGRTVKAYLNTTNLKTKTYTPKIKEQDKVLLIKARLFLPCTEVITKAEKQVIVINPNGETATAAGYGNGNGDSNDESGSDARLSSSGTREESGQKSGKKQKAAERSRISYTLLNMPPSIGNESEFSARLLIDNNDEPHRFDAWSYVYHGPKSYSGGREDNKQSVEIAPGESAIIQLDSIVEAAPGEYKYKVKVRKDGQASTTDITKEIVLLANASLLPEEALTNTSTTIVHPALAGRLEEVQNILQNKSIRELYPKQELRQQQEQVVYAGKSERIRQGIPYFLLALLGMIVLVFVWKH